MDNTDAGYVDRARALHARAILIDTHVDTTQRLMDPAWDFATRDHRGHVDLPRLREGGVGGVFFAVWGPGDRDAQESVASARRQLDRLAEVVSAHRDDLALARTAGDVRQAKADGRIALLIGIEGGHLIADSLDTLREFHRAGATYLTLTHALHTNWADSSGVHEALEPRHGGLTALGREMIAELNRLGMMVDISHASEATFWQALECSRAPIVATHSNCRALCDHRRNLTDEQLEAVADSGGVVQINFAACFLDPRLSRVDPSDMARWSKDEAIAERLQRACTTPLATLVAHFDHALKLIGPRHVGIGSDFDGVPMLPVGLEDCSKLPALTAELLGLGYSEDDLCLVLGENVLRVMDACAKVASES